MSTPSAYDLWKLAGGGTDGYDPAEYRRLMVEYGLLITLKPEETAEPLPCGWPHHRPDGTASNVGTERFVDLPDITGENR